MTEGSSASAAVTWRGNLGFLGEHTAFVLDHEGRNWFVYTKLPGDPITGTAKTRDDARARAEEWLSDWLRKAGLTTGERHGR